MLARDLQLTPGPREYLASAISILELEVLAGAVFLGNDGGLLLLGVVFCVLVLWCAVWCVCSIMRLIVIG